MTSRLFARGCVGVAAAVVLISCKESSGPPVIGPPSQLVLVNSQSIGVPANTVITTPIVISVQDAGGHAIAGEMVTFAVVDGGGSLAGSSAVSDANGNVTLPQWRLGKSAVPQVVRASLGSITKDISATVTTNYSIVVRFFGQAMTPAQQALFTNAAARLSGIVTGDIIDANAQNVDLSQCGVTGQPPLNEIIDDVIVYASIQNIDGQGKILAQAGPCLFRNRTQSDTLQMPAVGVMQFDAADINTLTGAGSLQEVITHEMLHVLGFGTLWENRGVLSGGGTPDPRFTGAQATSGCRNAGGTVTCAQSVPVEGTGGAGTADSHWRESSFDTELMTGFIDASPNPLSLMTIGSMADLGYVVNSADSDSYTIPGGLLRAGSPDVVRHEGWERPLPLENWLVLDNGHVRAVKKK